MSAHSGLSIAMGNASPEVQRAARRVTTSNEDEGFGARSSAWPVAHHIREVLRSGIGRPVMS